MQPKPHQAQKRLECFDPWPVKVSGFDLRWSGQELLMERMRLCEHVCDKSHLICLMRRGAQKPTP